MNNEIAEKIHEKSSAAGIYYKKTADKYRIAKFTVLILLALSVVLTIFFGNDALRGVHFRYLVKYFGISPITLDERYADIAYALGGGSDFALYHDDLAVLGEGKMALYDLAGDLKFRSDIETGNVSVDSSGKYLAAYVSGEETLTLFHSFGKANEIEFDLPISQVAVSDAGTLAVCMKETSGSVLAVMNGDFETEMTHVYDGIVMDMAISEDGKLLSVLTLSGSDGSYFTKLDLWNLKKREIIHTETLEVKKPITTGFFSNDRFYVILDRYIVFYSAGGEREEIVPFSSSSFQYHSDGDRLLFLDSLGNVTLFESGGKKTVSFSDSEPILSAKIADDTIYLLSEKAIRLYDTDGNMVSEAEIPNGVLEFFVLGDRSLLLCYASETKRITSIK